MSGALWLIFCAAVVLTALTMLVVRARRSLAAPVVGPPFSDAVRAVLEAAQREARARGHNQVGPEHLLLALCAEEASDSVALFSTDAVNIDALRWGAEQVMPPVGTPSIDGIELPYTARAHFALRTAVIKAGELQRSETGVDDVVVGLLTEGRNSAARVMREAGVTE